MAEPARRPLVSGNWKMHFDHLEALHFVRDLGFRLDDGDLQVIEVSVHPPFTDLRTVQSVVEDQTIPVTLGAQHCSSHASGAYTGEIGPPMLARLGVRYVLVGHSERRHLMGMTDAEVDATVSAVHAHGMVPLLCVGETEHEREEGETSAVLERQLSTALESIEPAVVAQMVMAYEPVWAIGTGLAATPEDAQSCCREIRERVERLFDPGVASALRIQYGGSVNRENAAELVAQPDVDGLLVGGASLDAAHFHDIIRAAAACYRSLVPTRGDPRRHGGSDQSGRVPETESTA